MELDTCYVHPKSGAMDGANLKMDLLKEEKKPVISLNPTEGCTKSWMICLELIACVC